MQLLRDEGLGRIVLAEGCLRNRERLTLDAYQAKILGVGQPECGQVRRIFRNARGWRYSALRNDANEKEDRASTCEESSAMQAFPKSAE
jgi:hypothetical protein